MYYGPEFIAEALRAWAEERDITLAFIEAGKPNQNAYIERFNRTIRHEVLDAWVFTSLAEVRAVSEEWRLSYNTERAHDSLGSVPPLTFLPRPTSGPESGLRLCA
jgi:putative transposase